MTRPDGDSPKGGDSSGFVGSMLPSGRGVGKMAGQEEAVPLNPESETAPDREPPTPRRRWTSTIGGMMALVLGVAIGLGWLIARHRAGRRVDSAMLGASMMIQLIQDDNPGHPTIRAKIGHAEFHWLGARRVDTYWMSSPTGPEVMVVVNVRIGDLRRRPRPRDVRVGGTVRDPVALGVRPESAGQPRGDPLGRGLVRGDIRTG